MKNVEVNASSLWNALFVASILAILGCVGFMVFAPPPPSIPVYSPPSDLDIVKAANLSKTAKDRIESKLWDLNSQELGASVLANLNEMSEKDHVQVSDFRIEKTVEVGSQTEAPFVAVLEGDFSDVMKVVGVLEDPKSKLGLSMLQMTNSDKGPGFVKATVAVTAFLRKVS